MSLLMRRNFSSFSSESQIPVVAIAGLKMAKKSFGSGKQSTWWCCGRAGRLKRSGGGTWAAAA
jgi:hypothetical protein